MLINVTADERDIIIAALGHDALANKIEHETLGDKEHLVVVHALRQWIHKNINVMDFTSRTMLSELADRLEGTK